MAQSGRDGYTGKSYSNSATTFQHTAARHAPKRILQETESQYLVEWTPTWIAKSSVDAALVRLWKEKQGTCSSANDTRNSGQSGLASASLESQSNETSYSDLNDETYQTDSSDQDYQPTNAGSSVQPKISKQQYAIVELSQHSSFPRQEYHSYPDPSFDDSQHLNLSGSSHPTDPYFGDSCLPDTCGERPRRPYGISNDPVPSTAPTPIETVQVAATSSLAEPTAFQDRPDRITRQPSQHNDIIEFPISQISGSSTDWSSAPRDKWTTHAETQRTAYSAQPSSQLARSSVGSSYYQAAQCDYQDETFSRLARETGDIRTDLSEPGIRSIFGTQVHLGPQSRHSRTPAGYARNMADTVQAEAASSEPLLFSQTANMDIPASANFMIGTDTFGTSDRAQHREAVVESNGDQEELQIDHSNEAPRSEYAVMLPMAQAVIDEYRTCIRKNAEFLQDFLSASHERNEGEEEHARKIALMLRDITTHVDLVLDESMSQAGLNPKQHVLWDNKNSKFAFLSALVDLLRDQPRIILILCTDGVLHILKRFLEAKDIQTRLEGTQQSVTDSGVLSVSLLTRTPDNDAVQLEKPDIIINFDTALDLHDPFPPLVKLHDRLENAVGHTGKAVIPIITLFASCSIEHVALCMSSDIEGGKHLSQALFRAALLRQGVGKTSGCRKPADAAELISNYILHTAATDQPFEWWLQDPFELAGIDIAGEDDSYENSASSPEMAEDKKRAAEDDLPDGPGKRVRLDEQSESSQAIDAFTTMPENSLGVTSTDGQSRNETQEQSPTGAQLEQIRHAAKSPPNRDAISGLEELNQKLEAQLQSHIESLEQLQDRYENNSRELKSVLRDQQKAKEVTLDLQRLLITKEDTIRNLTEQKTKLTADLQSVTRALETSEVPAVQELGQLRIAAADKEKVEKRLQAKEDELAFLRNAYQSASKQASELAQELQDANDKIAHLETQASGEAAKLKGIVVADRVDMMRREIELRDHRIADLELLVRRTAEENASLRNQRAVGVRQGSMPPRSPRLVPSSRIGSPAPLQFGAVVGSARHSRVSGVRDALV